MAADKKPLEDVLKNIVGGLSAGGVWTQEDMAAAWEAAVGAKAASHSKVRAIKGARLVVHVDGSGWLYELTVRKKEILGKLLSCMKDKKIKDITFRIGDLR